MRIPAQRRTPIASKASRRTPRCSTGCARSGRTGTKEGCAEGDCGACSRGDCRCAMRTANRACRSINSCLVPLPLLAGRECDGRGRRSAAKLHPVQAAMVRALTARNAATARRDSSCRCSRAFYRDDLHRPTAATRRSALRQSLPLHRLPADPRRGDRGVCATRRRRSRLDRCPNRRARRALDYAATDRAIFSGPTIARRSASRLIAANPDARWSRARRNSGWRSPSASDISRRSFRWKASAN